MRRLFRRAVLLQTAHLPVFRATWPFEPRSVLDQTAPEDRPDFAPYLKAASQEKRTGQIARFWSRPSSPTVSVPACVAAPCCALWLARLDRDSCPDQVRETSGKRPKRLSAGSAYRSKLREQTRRLRRVVPFWLSHRAPPARPCSSLPEKMWSSGLSNNRDSCRLGASRCAVPSQRPQSRVSEERCAPNRRAAEHRLALASALVAG